MRPRVAPPRVAPLGALALALALGACSSEPAPAASGEPDREAEARRLLTGPDWYRHAVFYEVYVRSFQDSDGDGIGDLPGLVSRLDELQALGVDALWLMPITPTPFFDSGYDVADYTGVNPDYGSLADVDALLAAAHARGMRVIVDLVLNHTSFEHPWFVESRSSRDNPKADWYVWSDVPDPPDNGCGVNGALFGDSAWEWDETRGQYYFHRFYPQQPDLDYRNPAVVEATLGAARFWLDRGVDGFRCDVVGLLHETATECDLAPGTVTYIQGLRSLLDEYPERVMVAESTDFENSAPYLGDGADMFHMAFNFAYGYFWGFHLTATDTTALREIFGRVQQSFPPGGQDALVIGSHDVQRAYRVAGGDETRHRRATLLQLTLPGTPFVYYGEELGLRPGTTFVVDNRDGARTPMLWDGSPGHGFTTGTPWLPFGAEAEVTHLAAQQGDPESLYTFYQALLALRRGRPAFSTGALAFLEPEVPSIFAYTRATERESYLVAVNLGAEAVTTRIPEAALPGDGTLLFGEGTLVRAGADATLTVGAATGAIFRTR